MADAVLLTGATGFVGRAVLAMLLARGDQVIATSRRPGAAQRGLTWFAGDLLEASDRATILRAGGRVGTLIHCAWDVTHGRFWDDPSNTLWRAASADLARRFLDQGGRRILALGSCAEYDWTAPGPWDENRPRRPVSAYGRAKHGLHGDLRAMAETAGATLIWARLFHLFGPGEDARRLVPSLIAALRAGQPASVRAPGLIRDFASTGHVAECLGALVDAPAAGGGGDGAVDIGSGAAQSLGALAETLGRLAGRPDLIRLGSGAADGGAEPPVMAPTLDRLHQRIGRRIEQPEQALATLLRQS